MCEFSYGQCLAMRRVPLVGYHFRSGNCADHNYCFVGQKIFVISDGFPMSHGFVQVRTVGGIALPEMVQVMPLAFQQCSSYC